MKNMKGFTLIELMIVVTIIGILAAILIPAYLNSTMEKSLVQKIMNNEELTQIESDFYQRFKERVDKKVAMARGVTRPRAQVRQEPAKKPKPRLKEEPSETVRAIEEQRAENLLILENQKLMMEAVLPVLKALEMNKEAAEMEKAIKSTEEAIRAHREGS